MLAFPILIDGGTGDAAKTWWNALVMEPLAAKLGMGFFSKFRYAKFTGLGTPNKKWTSKVGVDGTSNEILITAIELQDGTFVKADREESAPAATEDAPF